MRDRLVIDNNYVQKKSFVESDIFNTKGDAKESEGSVYFLARVTTLRQVL